jgi:hypothetical protein
MSAYGTITVAGRPVNLLPPSSWGLPQSAPGQPAAPFRRLELHHLRLDSARALPGLFDHTYRIFAAEIEAGRTYPQEAGILSGGDDDGEESDSPGATTTNDSDNHHTHTYSRAAFGAYFWTADVIVAIGQTDAVGGLDDILVGAGCGELVEASRAGRSWEDALVGFYYVKPNYPGRSSHVSVSYVPLPFSHPSAKRKYSVTRWVKRWVRLCRGARLTIIAVLLIKDPTEKQICNAGFVIPPAHRGFGYGKTLGKSYLHYGPSLGYKASVFNLVYANNTGSLKYVRAALEDDLQYHRFS